MAFLREAGGGANLTISTGVRVTKVTFEGQRACGVQLEDDSLVKARREVIPTAAALATPKLL